MYRLSLLATILTVLAVLTSTGTPRARADEVPQKYRQSINDGLKWLVEKQVVSDDKKEGHWSANGGQYPVAMTALAGMALLMEGSTIKDGKYAKQIERATNYLMKKAQVGNQRNGLIGDTNEQNEAIRYMYGHGFGLMFLSCVYGDEGNAKRRADLKRILTEAVKYVIDAQSSKGGWYYTSRKEGGDNDEGSVTITQVQALRAARNAGIPVPRDVIVKAQKYLKDCTSPRGQVYYSFNQKIERPAITAAAIACLFNSGEYKDEFAKKWLKSCQEMIPAGLGMQQGGIRIGHDEYTHYYYAQCVYTLGEKGWDKLFPEGGNNNKVTWIAYRDKMFDDLVKAQNKDGSWTSNQGGFGIGPVYSTAIYCTIMQLDKGTLPIYQR